MYYSKHHEDNQEQSLKNIPVENVNPINGSFMATSSIQYSQNNSSTETSMGGV